MTRVNDKHVGVARLYGNAALNLAEHEGQADSLIAELGELGQLLETHPDMEAFLTSPLVDLEDREKSLEKIFRGKASDLLVDTLQILNRNGRLEVLPTFIHVVREEHRELRGMIDVEVESAVALNDRLREKLKNAIKARTGKEAILQETVDAGLLGGIVVRVADQKFDASVRREIDEMQHVFHARALAQIYQSRELAISDDA